MEGTILLKHNDNMRKQHETIAQLCQTKAVDAGSRKRRKEDTDYTIARAPGGKWLLYWKGKLVKPYDWSGGVAEAPSSRQEDLVDAVAMLCGVDESAPDVQVHRSRCIPDAGHMPVVWNSSIPRYNEKREGKLSDTHSVFGLVDVKSEEPAQEDENPGKGEDEAEKKDQEVEADFDVSELRG